MGKRVSKGETQATAKRVEAAGDAGEGGPEWTTTSLHIRREHLTLLRRAAAVLGDRVDRAKGARASVSQVIAELIERHRAELET